MDKTYKQVSTWLSRKRILLFALLISITILGLAIYAFEHQNKWLETDYNKQNELAVQEGKFNDMFLSIQAAEAAVRGYAGTGNKRFIKNFDSVINSILAKYNNLKEFQDRESSSVDSALFVSLDSLVKQKIGFMEEIKRLCDADNCKEALALLATERGIMLSDSMIKVNEKTSSVIRDSLYLAKNTFTKVNRSNNNLAYAGIIMAMLLLCIVFYFLIREINRVNEITRKLAIQKEHFNITLNSISEGLITTGKDGGILYMNPSAEKMTGWYYEEVKNQPVQTVYDVVNEETGLPFRNIINRIIDEGEIILWENNTVLKTRNAESIIISNNGTPLLDENGQISGAVLVFKDITEKKRIEDALKQNEAQFRDMIENLPEAVYTCDAAGYIHLFNEAAVKLWGRTPVAGKDIWCGSFKIFNTDGTVLPLENCPMAIALKEARPVIGREVIVQRQDGTMRHILPSPIPLFNAAGVLTGAVNMMIDVTDKKEREILIKKTEEKYRNLVEQASDAILIYSFDGTIHEFNNIICNISGYTREEFSKLRLNDILIGDLVISSEKYEAILAGEVVTLYRKFKRKDNSVVDMEIKTKLLEDGNILGFGRDVTERNRNDEKLKKAIERYEILSRATSDTIWDWDIKNDTILYNDGISKMFGYSFDEIDNGAEWWKDNIHKDDKNRIENILGEAFKNRTEAVQLDYRYRCADYSYRNMLDRAFIVYDEDGNPGRMIGAMQDISWEKEHERQLAVTIIDTQEKERREIGMELHDNVNQLLSATLLYLGMAYRSAGDQKELTTPLKNCIDYVNESINDIRKLSHRLTPYTKDEVSLKDVIELLIEPMHETNQFEINIEVDEFSQDTVSRDIQTNLYRIIQEQMTNILKYAKAGKVDIIIKLEGSSVKLIITDDGIGFDPDTVKAGIGIENMRRRTEIFSGDFAINSSPGNGCELIAELPL
jgi:two-component system sensor histidine kinase UhpB